MVSFQCFNKEIIHKRRWYQPFSFMFVGRKAEITRASKSLVFTFAPMKCNYCDSECIRKGFIKLFSDSYVNPVSAINRKVIPIRSVQKIMKG
jgi:hypothetical protein